MGSFVGKIEELVGGRDYEDRALGLRNSVRDCIGEGGQSRRNFEIFVHWLGRM